MVCQKLSKRWLQFKKSIVCLCLTVCLSVCLSVTSRCSTETCKHRITQTKPHDSSGNLVFWCQRSPRNSRFRCVIYYNVWHTFVPDAGNTKGIIRKSPLTDQHSTINSLYLCANAPPYIRPVVDRVACGLTQNAGLENDGPTSYKYCSFMYSVWTEASHYRSTLRERGICCRRLSVRTSVSRKPVLCRNGWTNRAGFWHGSFLPPVPHCVIRKIGYIQKLEHFLLGLCPKLRT